MNFNKEAYKALQDVVGPDNISQDPAIIQPYMFQMSFGAAPSKLLPIVPGAAILPEKTEEVQAMVKICNKYKIKFLAHSTGFGSFTIPMVAGALLVDMRRMNRIIKIDEKNKYAIIEPYVIARQLQTEVIKLGFLSHVIGAGSSHSPLASATAFAGMGPTGNTTSQNGRNLLGFELVTGDGRIVRDGLVRDEFGDPGPSMRGIIRGDFGSAGGMGIFTKAAVKIYPWPGPPTPELTGSNPQYGWKVPENIRVYSLRFPDWERLSDAVYKLNEEGIAFASWSRALSEMIVNLTSSNNEYYDIWQKLEKEERMAENRCLLQLVVVSRTKKEMEFKEKVLNDILNETEGKEALTDLIGEKEKEVMYASFVANWMLARWCFRPTGDFGSTHMSYQDWDTNMRLAKLHEDYRPKYVKSGGIMEEGPHSMWFGPEEQYTHGHVEDLCYLDTKDPKSTKACFEQMMEEEVLAIKGKLYGGAPITFLVTPEEMLAKETLKIFSRKWTNIIRRIFDPNNATATLPCLEVKDIDKNFLAGMAKIIGGGPQ